MSEAKWIIAGKPDGVVPEVDKIYEIRHSRKGTFVGRILVVRGNFADVEVIEGKIHWASVSNQLFNRNPKIISIRDSLSYLIEQEER